MHILCVELFFLDFLLANYSIFAIIFHYLLMKNKSQE